MSLEKEAPAREVAPPADPAASPALPRVRLKTDTIVVGRPGERFRAERGRRADSNNAGGRSAAYTAATRTEDAESRESGIQQSDDAPESPAQSSSATSDQVAPLPQSTLERIASMADSEKGGAAVPDREAVRQTLQHYESAYETLDVIAAAKIWPSVDRRALSRAFATIRSQGVTFDRCEVDVIGSSATAHCNGVISFVPRVGSSAPLRSQQEWHFRMEKSDTEWIIKNVTAYQTAQPLMLRASHRP